MRGSKFNIYDVVFRVAMLSQIENWECFPGLHFYWEQRYGLVTLQICSSRGAFHTVRDTLQKATDLLMRNDYLFEHMQIDTHMVSRLGKFINI